MGKLFSKKGGRIFSNTLSKPSTNSNEQEALLPPPPPPSSTKSDRDLSDLLRFDLGKNQKSRIPQNNIKIHF